MPVIGSLLDGEGITVEAEVESAELPVGILSGFAEMARGGIHFLILHVYEVVEEGVFYPVKVPRVGVGEFPDDHVEDEEGGQVGRGGGEDGDDVFSVAVDPLL